MSFLFAGVIFLFAGAIFLFEGTIFLFAETINLIVIAIILFAGNLFLSAGTINLIVVASFLFVVASFLFARVIFLSAGSNYFPGVYFIRKVNPTKKASISGGFDILGTYRALPKRYFGLPGSNNPTIVKQPITFRLPLPINDIMVVCMFPYSLKIPKNNKEIVPQLNDLIKRHDCRYTAKKKNDLTTIVLYFLSEDLRTYFVSEFKTQFAAYAGLGTRLLATTKE